MRAPRKALAGAIAALMVAGLATTAASAEDSDKPWASDLELPETAPVDEGSSEDADPDPFGVHTAEAFGTATSFPDVGPGHPFEDEIAWLVDQGITTGYDDGEFKPSVSVSRQALAAFLFRLDGQTGGGVCAGLGAGPFPDVPRSHPFCAEITWLVNRGITTGYDDGRFHPNASISRQAIAAFLFRYIHEIAGEEDCVLGVEVFSDVKVGSGFCEPIRWMADAYPAPITTGYDDGSFRPAAAVSRQAMAAYLKRLRDAYPKHADVFEYDLAPGVTEHPASEVADVAATELAAAEYDEEGNMTKPAVKEWVVEFGPEVETVFTEGEGFFLAPGSAEFPSGLAGTVQEVGTADSGGTVVTVGESPLELLFNELLIEDVGGAVDLSADVEAGAPLGIGAGHLSVTTPTNFFTSGWACKLDTGPSLDPNIFKFENSRPQIVGHTVKVHIGLFVPNPSIEIWVETRTTVTAALDLSFEPTLAGHSFGCTIPGAASGGLERIIPMGTSGATMGLSPHIRLTGKLEGNYSIPFVVTHRTGYQFKNFLATPVVKFDVSRGASKGTIEFELRAELGVNVDVGFLDRVGFNVKAYLFAAASLALEFLGTEDDWLSGVRICIAGQVGFGIYLGIFLDVWVARWEVKLVNKEWPIAGLSYDRCYTVYSDPLTVASQYSGGYGDWVNAGQPVTPQFDPELYEEGALGTYDHDKPISGEEYVVEDIDLGEGGYSGPALDTTANELWSGGYSGNGYAGVSQTGDTTRPQPVMNIGSVAQVVPCDLGSTTAAITTGGRLWVWGDNTYGQAGDGSTGTDPIDPQVVPGLTNVARAFFNIQCDAIFAVRTNGDVYVWGKNTAGQLGLGDLDDRLTPTLMSGLSDLRQLEGTAGSVFARDGAGDVYAWGANEIGQLGIGINYGEILTPTQVPGLANIVDFSVGFNLYPIAVDSNGKVWIWGRFPYGTPYGGLAYSRAIQPMQASNFSNVVNVESLFGTYYAVTSNGLLYTWGQNASAWTGRGPDGGGWIAPGLVPRIPPVKQLLVRASNTVVVGTDDTVWTWGYTGPGLGQGPYPEEYFPGRVAGLENVDEVSAGRFYGDIFALLDNGDVWAWGFNGEGYALATGNTDVADRPVRVHLLGNIKDIQASVAWLNAISAGS